MVEKIGVEKSKSIMDSCDLSILILNNNEPLTDDDLELLNKIKTKKHIILINKIDLENKLDISSLNDEYLQKDRKNIPKW